LSRQALGKAACDKRIFFVDVGPDQYYPAFYLTERIDRKTLGKVTKLLGDLLGCKDATDLTAGTQALLGKRVVPI
jgi:hypothetical protein